MDCREIQENLALYADGELSERERGACESHLAICPLCRLELSELREVSLSLQSLKKPSAPVSLAFAVKRELAVARRIGVNDSTWSELNSWLEFRVSPYIFGSFASLILFGAMFLALANTRTAIGEWQETARQTDEQAVKMLVFNSNADFDTQRNANSSSSDLPFAGNATSLTASPILLDLPSLKPEGSLSHVATSLANGRLGKNEIVVVADVFSDGIARISQVVESSDEESMRELERLLSQEPAFVSSQIDKRPDKVQVVLLFQKVDVYADKNLARRNALAY